MRNKKNACMYTPDKSTFQGPTTCVELGDTCNIKIYKFENLNNDFLGLLIITLQ